MKLNLVSLDMEMFLVAGVAIPHFLNQKARFVTDRLMTRFNMELDDAVEMVLWSLNKSVGGEILFQSCRVLKYWILQRQLTKSVKSKSLVLDQVKK